MMQMAAGILVYADESKVKLFVAVVRHLISKMCRKSKGCMTRNTCLEGLRSRSLLLWKEGNELRLK